MVLSGFHPYGFLSIVCAHDIEGEIGSKDLLLETMRLSTLSELLNSSSSKGSSIGSPLSWATLELSSSGEVLFLS